MISFGFFLVGVIVVVVAVAIAVSIIKSEKEYEKKCQESQERYHAALEFLRTNPDDPEARLNCLELGRDLKFLTPRP